MNQAADVINLTIPAKPEFVSVVRLASSGIANRMGYNFDDIEDIKVAISEACTNVVSHAYKNHNMGKINIKIECTDCSLIITVIDHGDSFDIEDAVKKMKPLDPSKSLNQVGEGGLGLFLIDSLMDEVTICNDSGGIVKMIKFLNRDGVERRADKVSQTTDRTAKTHFSLSKES
ncbi:anti-sigma B factor RsbW [Sporolactobacillus sp. THM7-7]|nr:anti-sigma B factor RsbW [Sporolactobacillus sp. THM7-7]